ncbi:hypothetical protein CHUAL_007996 [Chamberlinius hualienensis]
MAARERLMSPPSVASNSTPNCSQSQTPEGLESIYHACRKIYPSQINPLQVTAIVKYWLGGPDPLDYVTMYSNEGNPELDVSPHWHYVSCGLSDLHGDGRVHLKSVSGTPSGFGFELTFRLKKEAKETNPPTWPAAVMQALAKYVFQSENILYAGDHVSWHCSLDNSESRIQHMLLTIDPQLGMLHSPHGSINFIQIVGVCSEELQAAQHWNGPGVIELMKQVRGAGGRYLVTDMRRGETIFELDPQVQESVDKGIEQDGSNLSGVSARCAWSEVDLIALEKTEMYERRLSEREIKPHLQQISELESEEIKAVLKKGLLSSRPSLPQLPNRHSTFYTSKGASKKSSYETSNASSSDTGTTLELLQTRTLEAVQITLNLEAGTLLPLVVKGRLRHGRHFTLKSVVGNVAITFVATQVVGAIVDNEHPFAAHGPWLQILLSEDALQKVEDDLQMLAHPDTLTLPKTLKWCDRRLTITIVAE